MVSISGARLAPRLSPTLYSPSISMLPFFLSQLSGSEQTRLQHLFYVLCLLWVSIANFLISHLLQLPAHQELLSFPLLLFSLVVLPFTPPRLPLLLLVLLHRLPLVAIPFLCNGPSRAALSGHGPTVEIHLCPHRP